MKTIRQNQLLKAARRIAKLFPEYLDIADAGTVYVADREFRTERYRAHKDEHKSFTESAMMANEETVLRILEDEL